MADKWFVSRQLYWGVPQEDGAVVEIAYGGLDFAGSDMLRARWRELGEGKEYTDPRAALSAARAVCAAWRKQSPQCPEIHIEVGATGGYTLPFTEHPTDADLDAWAAHAWDQIEKCDRCGLPLADDYYCSPLCDDRKYCSENCAELDCEDLAATL